MLEFTINERITALIAHEKLTANSFANRLGVKATVVYNIQKGRNKPSFDLIRKIMEVFDVSAAWLLSGEGGLKKRHISNDISNEPEKPLTDEDINGILVKLANSSLLYIDFHLRDILLNLRLLDEAITGNKFDRKSLLDSDEAMSTLTSYLKGGLKTGELTNQALLLGLLAFDEGIRIFLDKIRELSRDLYLNNSNPPN